MQPKDSMKQYKQDESQNHLISLYSKAAGSQAFIQQLFLKLIDDLKNIQDLKFLDKLISSYESLLAFNIIVPDDDKQLLMRDKIKSQKLILKLREDNAGLIEDKISRLQEYNHLKNSLSVVSQENDVPLTEIATYNWSSQLYSPRSLLENDNDNLTTPVHRINMSKQSPLLPMSSRFKKDGGQKSTRSDRKFGFFQLVQKSNLGSLLGDFNKQKINQND